MTSQSIADDITKSLRDATIVGHTHENWYLTCYISILFIAIFIARRLRNFHDLPNINTDITQVGEKDPLQSMPGNNIIPHTHMADKNTILSEEIKTWPDKILDENSLYIVFCRIEVK